MRNATHNVLVYALRFGICSVLCIVGPAYCADTETEKTQVEAKAQRYSPSNEAILRLGRAEILANGAMVFGYPGAGIKLLTKSNAVFLMAKSTGDGSYLGVRVNGKPPQKIRLKPELDRYLLLQQTANRLHSIEIVKHTETWQGLVTLEALELHQGSLLPQPAPADKRILFVGDSVTCGEGADPIRAEQPGKNSQWWNAHNSYGWQTAEALGAQVQLVCHGGRGLIRSWNGNTEEQNGPDYYQLTYSRPNAPQWDQKNYAADLIVISLGTNDFSLGIGALPTEQAFVPPYVAFVNTLLADHPTAQVVLTDGAIVNDNDDPARPQRSLLREYMHKTKAQVGSKRVWVFEASHFPGDAKDAHPTGPQHTLMSRELVAFVKNSLKGW